MALIGIISDTHNLLRPEALAALQGSDLILHAGDIGRPSILQDLRTIAPVEAVRGNMDKERWAQEIPISKILEIGGLRVYLRHNLQELNLVPAAAGMRVIVTGHTHQPLIREKDGVLFVNPGSAGPKRFQLPVSVARLEVAEDRVQAKRIDLVVAE